MYIPWSNSFKIYEEQKLCSDGSGKWVYIYTFKQGNDSFTRVELRLVTVKIQV